MRRSGFLLSLVVFLSAPLMAQAPTGTIAGTVTDQQAAVLPQATVTATNKATGAVRTVKSGGDGNFSLPSLPAGQYDVLIEATGFQPTISTVDVATGSTTSVKFTLQVSSRTEAITVTGAAALIDLESNKVQVGSSRVDLQACKLEYSIVSPK